MTASFPAFEEARLATLGSLNVLDTLPQWEFDGLVEIARTLLDVPIALVSLVDQDRQWFKAKAGLDVCETSRDLAFCAHAILQPEPLVVPDATLDPRFADNPLVTGGLGIRFYAGAPIVVEGQPIGTLCCIDVRPRRPEARSIAGLVALAAQASALFEARLRAERFAESERRFTAFLDHAPTPVFLKDAQGRNRYGNARWHEVVGCPIGSLDGQRDDAFLPPAVAEEVGRHDDQVRAAGRTLRLEERVPLADGTPRVWQTDKFPIRVDGEVWVGGVATDVTELREAEERVRWQGEELAARNLDLEAALREAETAQASAQMAAVRFEGLFGGLPVACFTYGEGGTIHEWNAAAEALFGVGPEQALLSSIYETVVGTEHRETQEDLVGRVFAGETVRDVERRQTMRDGRERWLLTSTFPLRSPSGRVVGAVSASLDITGRKAAEAAAQAGEARFRTVLDSLHEGVVVQDREGRVHLFNRGAERIVGVPGEHLDLRSALDPRSAGVRADGSPFPVDERPSALAIRDGRTHESVLGFDHPSGERRWISLIAAPLPTDDGSAPERAAVTILDVTDRLRMEGELRASEERFRTALESLHEGVVVQDASGAIVMWNQSAERTLGLTGDQLLGRSSLDPRWRTIREDGSPYPGEAHPAMRALATGTTQAPATMGVHQPDGALRWLEVCASPLRDVEGRTHSVVASFVDVTDRLNQARRIEAYSRDLEEANGRLESLATTDGLTGLKNHRFFQDALRRRVEQCRATGTPLSLALLDVDRFKAYNDDFGHPAGDAVLRGVAEALTRSVRATDLVARYGGEEFVIVMPGLDAAGAMRLAERVRERVAEAPFDLRSVTASFGVATLGAGQPDAEGLVRGADEALYRSKAAGRNRTTHWAAGELAGV